FVCRAVGISGPGRREFFFPFSLGYAWARERSHSSCFFRKAGRSLLSPPFWRAARQSWPLLEFCFSAKHHRGSGFSVSHSRSSVCFCCANKTALRARDPHHATFEH